MKRFKKYRPTVNGSTIIETVVSMTLLLTILTLFFTQIDKINGSVNPHLIYKAHNAVNLILSGENILIAEKAEYEFSGFKIIKKIETHQYGLYFIEVIAIDRLQRELYKRSKWISERIEL